MKIFRLVIDYFFLFFLLLLTVSFAWANWSFNPIWDLLFARVQGFLFYLNHPLSVLSFCIVCWVILFKNKFKSIVKTVSVILATPALGEIVYNCFFVQNINFVYVIPFFVLFTIGFCLASKHSRYILTIQYFFFLGWFILWFQIIGVHSTLMINHLPPMLNQYGYDLLSNIGESIGWLIASLFWLIIIIKKLF